MYTTYILYSDKLQQYYIGQTENLLRRIEEHNKGKTSFSKRGIPWILVYSEIFTERAAAVKLESKIKNRGAKRYLTDLEIKG